MNSTHPRRPARGLRRIVRVHLLSGTVGFCIGMLGAFALVAYGPQFTQASPFFTTMALVLISTIAGTMTGGLLSLSPLAERERK